MSTETVRPVRPAVLRVLSNRAVLGILFLVLLVVFFAWQLPETYLTLDNMKSILQQQATLIVLAIGVTFVLVIGEFDLSFAFTIGLAAAVSVLLMSSLGLPPIVAMLVAIVVGGIVGAGNGLAVAWGRAPAFIATLAVGSAATGVEQLLTGNSTISSGIPIEYLYFTLQEYAGLPISTWITLLLVLVAVGVVSFTRYGRRVRATGLNPTAVTLAGTSVSLVRLSAFVIMGLLAGLAGVMVSSLGGSYFPNSGAGLLLPPYAAVFLGAAIIGRGRFGPLASVYGVVFIALLERGLTMMNQKAAVILIIEGAVLVAAVILARQERKR
jgi:ribose transport system permease protein